MIATITADIVRSTSMQLEDWRKLRDQLRDLLDGFENDFDVEKEAPVLYIPDIFLDTFFHHPEFQGLTS